MSYSCAGFQPYFEKDFFRANWQVTQQCNFECTYCVNKDERKSNLYMSKEVMHRALTYINKLDRPAFNFSFSGGETTLYPYLAELLEQVDLLFGKRNCVINILTNGSASKKRIGKLLTQVQNAKLNFLITVHFGQTNIDNLASTIRSFSLEKQRGFQVKLVMPPISHQENKNKITDVIQILKDSNIVFSQRPVIDFSTGLLMEGYTDDELATFEPPYVKEEFFQYLHLDKKNKEESVNFLQGIQKKMFHYKNMYCSAGYHSLYLTEDGSVSKGQFCGKMPYTILEKNPLEDLNFLQPQKCVENHCTCVPYTILPKWSDYQYAPIYLRKLGL